MRKFFTIIFTFSSFFSFSQDLSNGLILHLPFNGNANDASGNGLHGTVDGATLTTDKDGTSNSAYYFGPTGNSINVAENTLLRPENVSVSVWFSAETDNIFYPLVFKGTVDDTTSYQYSILGFEETTTLGLLSLMRTTGDCNAYANLEGGVTGEPYIDASTAINYDNWHHAVITYDGASLKMYVDNQLISTDTKAPADIKECVGGGLNIGTCPAVIEVNDNDLQLIQWYFLGKIDEVRVYDRAISNAEVSLLYSSTTSNKLANMDAFFSVSPNPSNDGKYTLSTSMNLRSPEFTMMDYMGKQISFELLENGPTYSLDINNQPKGIYYLMIKDGDKVSTQKLVHQ